MDRILTTLDGNEAAAYVAYRVNEVCAIYPITPSSTMAELADQWASEGKPNLWGEIPLVVEMQSEGGAAGTVHGALQGGALTTTFTASQGLLLMIPNMYKIAGELTPAVFHVAARALAAQGLSIFGDHADIMATRATGWAMLAASNVQEAHDMALVAQDATLRSRIPFIHFFDGFRTSHEVNKLTLLGDDQIRAMIDDELVRGHRARALNPDHPFIRGTAQNPDVYFQARETVNPFYDACPGIVEDSLKRFGELTGRHYGLYEYHGHPEAERVVVVMGSGASTVLQTVQYLQQQGDKVGLLKVRLFRPFDAGRLVAALPVTTRRLAVLDRTKEPGSAGEPLYQDVLTACGEAHMSGRLATLPRVIGGRYGLSSKEFTPAMVKAVFDELAREQPKNHFTVGINDDVSHTSLSVDESFDIEPPGVVRAVFYGLGADGTVGANKNSIKIIGSDPDYYAQGYFVYDSKKSGSQTVSHLRFGRDPIDSPYLVQAASFIGIHQAGFLDRTEVLDRAAEGAVVLLNSPLGPDAVWERLPRPVQETIIDKGLQLYVVDASKVAREAGLGNRTNTVLQTCFFAISGVMPRDEAIAKIKTTIEKTYGKKGADVVQKNFQAVDTTLESLHQVSIPGTVTSTRERISVVPASAPEFVQQVTAKMMANQGDRIPVSKLPADGTYPSGTTAMEKRDIAAFVPKWEPDICIQCGNCSFVCPHAVIRAKFYDRSHLEGAPESFQAAPINARGFPDIQYSLQIYAEDCTSCGLCVEVCPAKSPTESGVKAINMTPNDGRSLLERDNIAFFEKLPMNDRSRVDFASVRGAQFLEPLFQFSGACAGCGETPYVKLVSQLFGDRMIVANATGCSSIYGGNLPTTPWSQNAEGRGPAWSNSLFEDNAEFGLGFRTAADQHTALARRLALEMKDQLGAELVAEVLAAPQRLESELRTQRERVAALKAQALQLDTPEARDFLSVADHLVRRSIWLIGGDGWAYDIGYGGLDHVLATGRDVNILVMDTEVYSNTGGQMSKSTPPAAVAKFAAAGKAGQKKDLAMQAIAYGNVYVARIAMGANPQQTLLAFREAEAYPGPSIILAYSHCIAHGYNLQYGMAQQDKAVNSGYWPLLRFNPTLRDSGQNPFSLDSLRPRIPFKDYAYQELRYRMLTRTNPQAAEQLLGIAQTALHQRWNAYEELATRDGSHFHPDGRSLT